MANITLSEAEYLRDLGQMVLETLGSAIDAFEAEADSVFTGQGVADFLYEKAVNLRAKYQKRINEIVEED